MNAIDYLLIEHQDHRHMLAMIPENHGVFPKFRSDLIHHINMEEAVFYLNLLKIPDLEQTVREAWDDHSVCMDLLQEMDSRGIL